MDNFSEKNGAPGPITATLMRLGAVGAFNAVPSREAMRALGLDDMRTFRLLVEHERRNALILANGRGLFLPAEGEQGRAEIRRWELTTLSRIAGLSRALKTARGTLRMVDGQQKIEISEGCGDEG